MHDKKRYIEPNIAPSRVAGAFLRHVEHGNPQSTAHLNHGTDRMNLAAALLLGHLLADFPLQTTWIYQYKTKSWKGILIHTAIHVLVTACLVKPLLQALPLLILLGILHFLTDYTKVRIPARQQSPGFL
ncbi:MAG: DUF3307 domain-containing protein, partial [Caldilineaceae bacterium]|nr:DUF3307 domain-containing protein [Caldilineaceae bacterium]